MSRVSHFLPLPPKTWMALVTLLAGGTMLAAGTSRATAADTEVREFTVTVDGKRGGQYSMTVTRQDDGSTTMFGATDIRLSYLAGLKVYTYTYRGTESWDKDRPLAASGEQQQ